MERKKKDGCYDESNRNSSSSSIVNEEINVEDHDKPWSMPNNNNNNPYKTLERSRTPSSTSSTSTQLHRPQSNSMQDQRKSAASKDSPSENSYGAGARTGSFNEHDSACAFSRVTSLPNDHHKQSASLDGSAANTLVEAALDKEEAKDRHVRFQDHVVESAALVQRMLSVRLGQDPGPDPIGKFMQQRHERRDNRDIEMQTPQPNVGGGGSVLASLMKLEMHSTTKSNEKKKKSKKTLHIKRKQRKPRSLHEYPIYSNTNTNELNTSFSHPKRPPLVNRPTSWLSEMASSKYVVPSLEKRKKFAAPSATRRNSNDSMITTASQFERITLEDRIRITFEIANILQKQEFLVKLCKCLMLYGCPAHRIEYSMRQVSRTLGVKAEYVYLPNVMLVTFIDSTTHTTETHFITQGQTFELHRLSDVYRLEKLVAHGEVSIDEALEFIDKVQSQPQIYPTWLQPFCYALAAFSGCVLFYGGRWKEGGVAAALGMVFATHEIFSTFISSFQPIWEITVCILIGFVARGLQKYDFCFTPIGFSSFIIVLPGYPMTVGIIELVSRQPVSGVVRMVYAIIYAFLLGYGISMGSELYLLIDKSTPVEQSEICKQASNAATCISNESQWFNFLLVPLFAVAYCVWLRARPPRWPIMMAVSACTYLINYALACWANAPSQILQVVPAFGLGLLGNLLSKFTGKMSFDAVLLGVFYLVPSSLGIKAAYGLFSGTDEVGSQGADFALAMIESSIGITLGLFLATLVVYPKGTQHTPLMNL